MEAQSFSSQDKKRALFWLDGSDPIFDHFPNGVVTRSLLFSAMGPIVVRSASFCPLDVCSFAESPKLAS